MQRFGGYRSNSGHRRHARIRALLSIVLRRLKLFAGHAAHLIRQDQDFLFSPFVAEVGKHVLLADPARSDIGPCAIYWKTPGEPLTFCPVQCPRKTSVAALVLSFYEAAINRKFLRQGVKFLALGTVWLIDCEWGYRDGRIDYETAVTPVVFCAQRAPLVGDRSQERYSFWGRDHGLKQFIDDHFSTLFVSHNNLAEMKFLLRFGIVLPPSWWDTMVGYKVLYNCPKRPDISLIGVLKQLGLPHISTAQKTNLRDKILNLQFNADSPVDRAIITNYCYQDCIDCGLIYEQIRDQIDPATMQYWCRYLAAIARMELHGIPTDVRKAHLIWLAGTDIADFLRTKVNSTVQVYTNTVLSKKRFLKWAEEIGIEWPWRTNPKGKPIQSIDDDTLKAMSPYHSLIPLLRQVRKTLSSLGNRSLKFDGRSGRHHFDTWPFGTITGRNSSSKFLFTAPKWCRHLIVPKSPEHTLFYCDFKVQEFGVVQVSQAI